MTPTCFLILGAPRSGTSLAAGILHNLGVPMGEWIDDPVDPRWDFIGADEWNPKGFFEDAAFVNICSAILGWPYPDSDVELTATNRKKLQSLLVRRSAANEEWGVKCAGIAYFVGAFIDLCPVPVKIILCQRHHDRAVSSWMARAGCVEAEAKAVIGGVTKQIRKNLIEVSRLELDFDRLKEWPELLADYTGRPLTDTAKTFPDISLVRF